MIELAMTEDEYVASLRSIVRQHADSFAEALFTHDPGCLKVLLTEFIFEEARLEVCDFLADWLAGEFDGS